jgi:SAM-dependent methyltransferase
MTGQERPYHKYIFDQVGRQFVGAFEEMYRAEHHEGFDSWGQDDMLSLGKRLALAILWGRSYGSVLDMGCGKGAFTSLLKTPENRVVGLDISPTAIQKAKGRFPAVEFEVADINDLAQLQPHLAGGVNLVVLKEVLSYVANWRELVRSVARAADYALLSLYLPPNPIGFVKTFADFKECLEESHETIHEVMVDQQSLFLFSERRLAKPN